MRESNRSSGAPWRLLSAVTLLAFVLCGPLRLLGSAAEQVPQVPVKTEDVARTVTANIPVEGMSCGSCAASIKRATRAIDGVRDVDVDLVERRARVEYDAQRTSPEKIRAAIEELGYRTGTPVAESR